MNARLQQVADHVAERARALIVEAEDEITEAINVTVETAQGEEKHPVLSLPVTAKWNLDTNEIEVSLSVNVRHKFTSEATLKDPNQPELLDREGDPLPESIAKPLGKLRDVLKAGNVTIRVKEDGEA